MKQVAAAFCLALAALPAVGQEVSQCDWRASSWNLVEPWDANSRTFANGEVRLAVLDTIEPGAAAFNLLVLSPPYDEMGGRQCRIVSYDPGIGFYSLTLDGLEADYDPAVGLIFHLPVEIFLGDKNNIIARPLTVTLNQASGVIRASLP